MKATRFLAFLLAFVLAFSSVGAADVFAAGTLSGNQVTEETLSGNDISSEDVQAPMEEPVVKEEQAAQNEIVAAEEVSVKKDAALVVIEDISVQIDVRNVEEDYSWIYDDETLNVNVSVDDLPEGATVEAVAGEFGNEPEGNYSYSFTPFNDTYYTYDKEQFVITLYGEKIVPYLRNKDVYDFGVRVIVKDDNGNEIFSQNPTWQFWAEESYIEYNYPCSNPGDNIMLIEESIDIGKKLNCWGANGQNPYGTNQWVEITSLSVAETQHSYEFGDGAYDIIGVEDRGNEGWELIGKGLGYADVTIKFKDWFHGDEEQSYTFTVYSEDIKGELYLEYPNDNNMLLKGQEKDIQTSLKFRYIDDEGRYQEKWIEDYTLSFEVYEEGEEPKYVPTFDGEHVKFSIDDKTIKAKASDDDYGWDNVDIRVNYTFQGDDLECTSRIDMGVTDSYFSIETINNVENVEVGDTIDMNDYINVYQYKEGWDEPLDVINKNDNAKNDRKHRIRLGWDENVWVPVGEDENDPAPELKRISNEHGSITVIPQWTEPFDSEEYDANEYTDYGGFERRFEFEGFDYSVWMEELPERDRDWVYTDENLTYEFNTDHLNNENVKLIARIGYFEEGAETPTMFAEDTCTVDEKNGKHTLTLHGDKINEYLPQNYESFWVFFSAAIEVDGVDVILFEGDREVGLRQAGADYSFPEEWVSLLVGDGLDISKDVDVSYHDKDHPFGAETEVEIKNIKILRQREYCDVSEEWPEGKRPTAKSIVFLSKDDNGWHLYGEDHGEAELQLTYQDIYGEEKDYCFTVSSSGGVFELDLGTHDDRVRMTPGSELILDTLATRRYLAGKENQQKEVLHDYRITFRDDEEFVESLVSSHASFAVNENNQIVIQAKEDVWGEYWFNVRVEGIYTENDGSVQEYNIDRWYCLELNGEVYTLELGNASAIDPLTNVGETVDLCDAKPKIWVQKHGEDSATELSEEEVYFSVENLDENAWNVVDRDENSIVLLERKGTWETDLWLVARKTENQEEVARHRFVFTGIEPWYKNLRGGDWTWIYVDEESHELDLDMRYFAGLSDVKVDWTVGEMQDGAFTEKLASKAVIADSANQNDIDQLKKDYQYVVDQDGFSISLNGGKLAENFMPEDGNGEVFVQALIRIGDREICKLNTRVELRNTVCRLDGEDNSEVEFWEGNGWVYNQNTIEAWVECGEYPYGQDVKLYIEDIRLENHDDENPAFVLYHDRYSGYWNICAERMGGATATFTVSHGRMGTFDVTKNLYTSDEMYLLKVFSDTGTHTLYSGETINLITDFYKYKSDHKGNVEETYIPEDQYQISIWADDPRLLSFSSTDKTVTAFKNRTGGTNVHVEVAFYRENGDEDSREYVLWMEVADRFMTLTSEKYYAEPNSIHDIDKFDISIVEKYFDEDGKLVVNRFKPDKVRFQDVGNANYFWITWWNQKLAVNNKFSRELPMDNRVNVIAEYDGQQFEGWVNVVVCEHDYKKETMTASDGSVTTYDYCTKCDHEKNYKTFKLSKTSYTFNRSVQKPSVIVQDKNGKAIDSKYYSVSYSSGCKNAGTYKVTIAFRGEYSGSETLSYKINAKEITPAVTLSKTEFTYNGKTQTPTVTVKDGSTKLTVNTDYTVSYSSGRKNVGKYTVKVTLKGNYSGTKSVTYQIIPKGTSISKLTAASKAFTVTWKKQSTQTSGYQIQYSTSSKFTSAKTVTVSGTSTVSKKISKLTGKKKYYVRVRTYKTVSGTKYYSSWSSKKYVTTKK